MRGRHRSTDGFGEESPPEKRHPRQVIGQAIGSEPERRPRRAQLLFIAKVIGQAMTGGSAAHVGGRTTRPASETPRVAADFGLQGFPTRPEGVDGLTHYRTVLELLPQQFLDGVDP